MQKEQIFIIESPVSMIEGEILRYSVEFLDSDTVTNADMIVYHEGKPVTGDILISGDSFIYNPPVLTLKKITAKDGHGGGDYVVIIEAIVDGNTERKTKWVIIILITT